MIEAFLAGAPIDYASAGVDYGANPGVAWVPEFRDRVLISWRRLIRVAYARGEWSRAEAWEHLHAQHVPGCPKIWHAFAAPQAGRRRRTIGGVWRHGWERSHTSTEWAWEYVG